MFATSQSQPLSDTFFREFPKRNPVKVILSKPLLAHPGENALAFTDRIMFELAANLPEEMRGVYAEKPEGFKPKEW